MHVLFDLDGTCPHEEALTDYVGPALATAFAALLETSDPVRIDEAIGAFRQRFERLGMFENALYPGIAEAVAEVAAMGFRLCLVTAKPHVYARRILEHFRLEGRFSGVYGPELSDRMYSKEALIRQACLAQRVIPRESVMVGDRLEDVLGAKANGLRTVVALWGYGNQAELEAAQPDHLVRTSAELVACLRAARSQPTPPVA